MMRFEEKILVLTPLKDASHYLEGYFKGLASLTYPPKLLSLGFLESDSSDDTFSRIAALAGQFADCFRRIGVWKKDFGFRLLPGIHRGAAEQQLFRRTILAKSRNHLLFHALDDEDWVLWLDADIIGYPHDILERLLVTGRSIVQPHCVLEPGGSTFDRNGWRDHGRLHLDDLRDEGELVRLDAVGGTMLLVRADIHRDGLIFPSFPYGPPNRLARQERGELETEGLGIMARDMGHQCWGMPRLEILHDRT